MTVVRYGLDPPRDVFRRRVEELVQQVGAGHVGELAVVAVHRLRPGGHRAADGPVDDVRVEALVGERQVARLGVRARRVVSFRAELFERFATPAARAASMGASSWCSPSSSCSIARSVQRPSRLPRVQYSRRCDSLPGLPVWLMRSPSRSDVK